MKPLPTLTCLQAFEAAARLGSFTAAARERHLSHSAISRHIQTLEHWCDAPLFAREGPRIALTPAGHALAQRLADPLHSLYQALCSPQEVLAVQPLKVFTLSSIAGSWLLPRLAAFQQRHPAVELSIETGHEMINLPPHQPTVALRYGTFSRAGLATDLLFSERFSVAATPAWFEQYGTQPEHWPAPQMLRHQSTPWPSHAPGPGRQRPALPLASGIEFNDMMLLIEAATQGLGVGWMRTGLAQSYFRSGQLRRLEGFSADNDKFYWLAYRSELASHPTIAAFRDWLLQEARGGFGTEQPAEPGQTAPARNPG
ncbi:LysR substrate-binding domain-containing protein [Chitinimonas lacunae]|uniref:LysR substrate-binding domain-containing protein n=1 Tax=Chitinimonas lacunae TaxID=1963018 RepID=A0ABV8MQT6_9NEIS